MAGLGNKLLRDGIDGLRRRMPPGWKVEETRGAGRGPDICAKITAPDRRSTTLRLAAKAQLDPRSTLGLLAQLREDGVVAPLVVARFLSTSVRDRLREADVSFIDLTGNVRVVLRDPGLFIEAEGAEKNPERKPKAVRSLRGAKAGRLVRALIDFRKVSGVRDLAASAHVDAGYASRVLAFLDTEALVRRGARGRIEEVDWVRLLRRWAEEAPLESRGHIQPFLEPRGLSALPAKLAKLKIQYAATASLAAVRIAPVAPTRLAVLYVANAKSAADVLELRATEAGANIWLVETNDNGVFERAQTTEGISYAAPSQVAADLLTSPGRGPAEGEELLSWMMQNEEAWRG